MIPINPDDPIREIMDVEPPELSDEERERHNIYMLLTLTLVYDTWCIRKDKPDVVEEYEQFEPGRDFNEYVGHNIGALLVGEDNRIVTASMNNNYLYNNSTEHAESRLVRKGMRIYNRLRYKTGEGLFGYSSVLRGHTVYTSLESCSQCSGIMDLANVAEVVYAQTDYGQGHVGNILYNFHKDEGAYGAPRPIQAKFLPIFDVLKEAWDDYTAGLGRSRDLTSRRRPSTTGFLRSVHSAGAYREAAQQFENLSPIEGDNPALYDQAAEFRRQYFRISYRDAVFGA